MPKMFAVIREADLPALAQQLYEPLARDGGEPDESVVEQLLNDAIVTVDVPVAEGKPKVVKLDLDTYVGVDVVADGLVREKVAFLLAGAEEDAGDCAYDSTYSVWAGLNGKAKSAWTLPWDSFMGEFKCCELLSPRNNLRRDRWVQGDCADYIELARLVCDEEWGVIVTSRADSGHRYDPIFGFHPLTDPK